MLEYFIVSLADVYTMILFVYVLMSWIPQKSGIVADIELIRGDEINEAWERMVKGDVKYRFVIDSATLAG